MTESQNTIEGSKIEQALAKDQHEQRLEQEAAIKREEDLINRLAAQLANRSHPDPS